MNLRNLASVSSRISVAFLLAATLGLAGCGGEVGPEYGKVKGTVTLDGQPVEIGNITFLPTGETKGPASGALIAADGTYELVGPGGKGVVVGTHQVTVACPEAGSGPSTGEDPQAGNAPCVIPAKYGDPRTSKITKEVKSGEDNVINIELTK